MPQSLDHILHRAVAEIISEAGLRARLASGRSLRLKMGFDPSRPLLTIGNAVGIRKLRQFQELGHQVVPIDHIIGSEGRYADFDRRISEAEKRWMTSRLCGLLSRSNSRYRIGIPALIAHEPPFM